jgi:ABC-type uncharacterized transport system permease subunit
MKSFGARIDDTIRNFSSRMVRQSVGRKAAIFSLSVLAALVIGAAFLLVLKVNPLTAYYYLLIRPFGSFNSIGEMSIKLVPICWWAWAYRSPFPQS